MLIPSIDLMNGKAVQLKQGKEKILERDNVFELLEEFSIYGEVAIIDLDAALGKGNNEQLIIDLLKVRPCRVGGGIRDLETAQRYLKAGASKIIIGTKCRESWVKKLPRESLIFAIDAKGDYWSTAGWTNTESITVNELIPELEKDCSEFLYTQVEKEGMLQGLDRERIQQVVNLSKLPVTIAGGISTLDDIQWFTALGANGQIGMSIYTGQLQLQDCFIAQLDFEKSELIPTIVQDASTGKVLMLAYSSQESLVQALSSKQGTYWSRSRQEIWTKGLTSGNTQQLVNADVDCDGDTLLFKVNQTGNACHFERYSCFSSEQNDFTLNKLEQLLEQRKQTLPDDSFSTKLFRSDKLRAEKIQEEALELIEAQSFDDVRWEAADLLFFALTDALAKGVSLSDITSELRSRFNDRPMK
ncbi:bifunctional phosphoribosyl-AMP cyclohydrolase/phosphoribosyl-ATP diphosphatase HisIE [Pleionea litopenaei]|uniref:Histidine biosynthesis bifunctional protein HisIE n=1 Tax=Pleionea litopenaei TaxID=3070815 RepID=A0AA51RTV2_9GAMM|nr:bifunctional phosphoribosyl-AMP cyclohydrolase/phosphoribosyl-ATP diphosphatase HisIE [Pleionea sp. HL-JVS1]WMS87410.1 bifunctional phosphoribosyl-AMP cyclohydrolase/phosphoribosyl-ATP diphosphatase HisIE [Pleionea sp. HL-JVS1]